VLAVVEKNGLKLFSLKELERLRELVEKKDYSYSRKADRAKTKLLNKINVAVYEKEEGRQGI
jgi:hypothetical protein